VDVFNDQAKVLIKKLDSTADGVTKVNVFNDITLCVLDIICGKYGYCSLWAPGVVCIYFTNLICNQSNSTIMNM